MQADDCRSWKGWLGRISGERILPDTPRGIRTLTL